VKRRDFIVLLGGAAVGWPLAARAQQRERMRVIGVLVPLVEHDTSAKAQVGAFVASLQQAGWSEGRNLRLEIRWAGPSPTDIRRHAAELVALQPDVVLAYGSSTVGPLLQNTRTVPIVFPVMGDPVAAGYVESLARSRVHHAHRRRGSVAARDARAAAGDAGDWIPKREIVGRGGIGGSRVSPRPGRGRLHRR
jgi:putative tryptophan/tyrosine transport system substrate-binding protein